MRQMFIVAAAIGILSSIAAAGDVVEFEPNGSLLTAQALGMLTPGAFSILGSIDEADVDYFSMQINANTLVGVSIFDFTPEDPFDNDSFIGLFDSGGTLLISDDDNGPGFLSQFSIILPEAGTYFLALSGFGDDEFIGSHDQFFAYQAVVMTTPVPGPAALLCLLPGLVLQRRRRAI